MKLGIKTTWIAVSMFLCGYFVTTVDDFIMGLLAEVAFYMCMIYDEGVTKRAR